MRGGQGQPGEPKPAVQECLPAVHGGRFLVVSPAGEQRAPERQGRDHRCDTTRQRICLTWTARWGTASRCGLWLWSGAWPSADARSRPRKWKRWATGGSGSIFWTICAGDFRADVTTARGWMSGWSATSDGSSAEVRPESRRPLTCSSDRRQHAVAIVSGAGRKMVGEWGEELGLQPHLRFYLGCGDYPVGKPDPACYLTAAARVDLPPAWCSRIRVPACAPPRRPA